MRYIKATERLPELPNTLPPDTEDERGVLFINRTHSCAGFWYPSYGRTAKEFLDNFNGWPIEQFEWIDEQPSVNQQMLEALKPEYIICSAIHFSDGKTYDHQPKNIESGFVISGRRHHNCYSTLQAIGASLGMEGIVRNHIERIDRDNQGFITNTNRYVDRKEGMRIAKAANQLINPKLHSDNEDSILTSEDLY